MKRTFTLIDLIGVLVILALILATLVPAVHQAVLNSKSRACTSNMSQLTKAAYNYSISRSNPEGSFPTGVTGGRVWRLMVETGEVADPAMIVCPAEEHGRVYRGPRADWTVLICCRPENHGGFDGPAFEMGKTGDVNLRTGESAWRRLLDQTED